jgi:hypothetical protein
MLPPVDFTTGGSQKNNAENYIFSLPDFALSITDYLLLYKNAGKKQHIG